MFLKSVLIRFYKSFNYDYLRKSDSKVKAPLPWETFDGMWYPYVTIPIEQDITAVVGENESGKSHLLHAIEQGISGQEITREDFCATLCSSQSRLARCNGQTLGSNGA